MPVYGDIWSEEGKANYKKIKELFIDDVKNKKSFVIYFPNTVTFKNTMLDLKRDYPEHHVRILKDMENNKKTYSEILDYLKKYYEKEFYLNLDNQFHKIASHEGDGLWYNENSVKSYVNEKLEYFKNSFNHRGIFIILKYGVDDAEEKFIRYQIMPYFPFCFVVNCLKY